jgi:hypothetical protein
MKTIVFEDDVRRMYPEWTITRATRGPRLGELIATHPAIPSKFHGITPEQLALRLEAPELWRLQECYGDRYSIRRTPGLWMATPLRSVGGGAPLTEDTPDALEQQIREHAGLLRPA